MKQTRVTAAAAFVLVTATVASAQTFGPPSARQRNVSPPPATASEPQRNFQRSEPTLPSDACSAAYYKALEPLRTGRGAVLGNLTKALRTTDPDLTGKWQITAQPTGKPKPPPKPERVCAETKDVPGKSPRCVRYELKQPVIPPDVVAKLPATADEARVIKAADDYAVSRGQLPDVGSNGRQFLLVNRVALELRNYVSQPEHPSMCAGSDELITFYREQIAPLKKRMDDLTALSKQATTLAAARVRGVAVAELKVYDKAVADAAKVEAQRTKLVDAHRVALTKHAEAIAAAPAGTLPPPPPTEPVLPPLPTLPIKPTGPAQADDYAVVGLPSLVSEALRPLLPQATVTAITDERVPTKIFMKARAALLDEAAPHSTAHPDVREASLMALRLLEARVYTDLYVSRFKELDAALFGSITDIRTAQSASCTCRD